MVEMHSSPDDRGGMIGLALVYACRFGACHSQTSMGHRCLNLMFAKMSKAPAIALEEDLKVQPKILRNILSPDGISPIDVPVQ